jgi:hypothetical protein
MNTSALVLTHEENYVMSLLGHGRVANRAVANEFRINNGPPQDMRIIVGLFRSVS